MKKVYFDCSCSSFHCVVRFAYFQDEKDFIYLETFWPQHSFLKRLWRSIKYTFGFYEPQADSVLERDTVRQLRDECDSFLDYDMVPEKDRAMFDWLYKYDTKLAGKPKEILATLISKGAEQLYKEGLENADPLPPEVAEAMAEAGRAALEEALKDKPEDDCS